METEEKAIELYKQLKVSLKKRGLNLTKWINNKRLVMNSFPIQHKAESTTEIIEAEPAISSLVEL